MEVKACMGCFVEWDRERDECPVCGWSPQKPLEEDKNGWHQGKIIAKESLPTMPTVEKICDALGVTMAQFFAGMDVPVSLSESQQEVLNIWNNLDEKEQNVVIQMLRGLQK